jgi:hypothetical protein
LIARKYSPQAALYLFTQWANGGTPNRLHMALVGIEVLLMAGKLDAKERVKAQAVLADLERS